MSGGRVKKILFGSRQPAGLSQRGAGSLGKGGCLWVQWWEALVDYKVFKKCDGV